MKWIKFCYYCYSFHVDVSAFKKITNLYNFYLAIKIFTATIIM